MSSEIQFYREEKFKVVEADGFKLEIPEGWEVVRLGETVEVYDHKRIPLSEQERANRKGSYPYCGATGIIDYIDDYIFEGEYILLAEDGGYFGPFEQSTYIMNGKFWVNNHAHVLKARDDVANNWYLMYTLNYIDLRPYIVGSTRAKLNQSDMRRIFIPLPPLPEQQKIAHVLTTIDKAIEAVDEAIKQAERIKKGLMQELLTKGIGHKKFRVVEADGFKLEIPEGWEVVRLRDVAEIRKNKVRNDFTEVAFIPMELVPDSEIFAKYEVRNISDISSSTYCEANDLLLAKITPSFENGKQGIVPENIPNGFAFATTEVYPIVCKDINNLFLFYLLKFQKFRKMLEFSMRGTTGRQRVPKKAVEDLRIPLPPLPEQQKIAEILSKWDEVIELKKAKKERLERMKKKVMELLLTGKVRVK